MSSTHTSQATLKHSGAFGRLWRVGLLTVLAAVIMNTLISLLAKALFSVAPTFQPLQVEGFIPSTVIGVTGAVVVFALIMRWAKQPIRLFQRVAVAVLLISLLPDLLLPALQLYPGTTFPEVGALLLMHIATAFICLGILSSVKVER
jgi:uncharacterized membrane protein YeaQ/YmgE (transglycosylase-associated protein family)